MKLLGVYLFLGNTVSILLKTYLKYNLLKFI